MSKRLKAPDGTELSGVLQNITGYSVCGGLNDDGNPEYEDETEIDWDAMTEVTRWNDSTKAMERVWIDRDGGEWLESELVEDVEEPDAGC
jgi:hypothetical protein